LRAASRTYRRSLKVREAARRYRQSLKLREAARRYRQFPFCRSMPLDMSVVLFEARFYQPHSTTDDARDEIREAASLYGLDLAMMMSIAKVESDFNSRTRTGSYKGLFQLSDYEFEKYGDGSIWDARDNARAAAHMFLIQAEKFRWALGHYPDYSERYMVHQQGIQGAIEHYSHPERLAWQSMCVTDEGLLKGEHWCKKCHLGKPFPTMETDPFARGQVSRREKAPPNTR
jgi:hypothetical protein